MRHNGFYSEYSKPGGYSQTKKDFDRAVDPTTVQTFKLPAGVCYLLLSDLGIPCLFRMSVSKMTPNILTFACVIQL